eukprot:4320298-Alexandrium_andersonii.AAC.1
MGPTCAYRRWCPAEQPRTCPAEQPRAACKVVSKAARSVSASCGPRLPFLDRGTAQQTPGK